MHLPNPHPHLMPPTPTPRKPEAREHRQPSEPGDSPRVLTFSPLAWAKAQFFVHAADTEAGGFGVSADDNLLYLEDFVTVRQRVTRTSVAFDDTAVADHFDQMADAGKPPAQFGRIWIHTHPDASPLPSRTDEATFARSFGRCDWAVMVILGRTGQVYARLTFAAGPSASLLLPVAVDWPRWPQVVCGPRPFTYYFEKWMHEFMDHIQVEPSAPPEPVASTPGEPEDRPEEMEPVPTPDELLVETDVRGDGQGREVAP